MTADKTDWAALRARKAAVGSLPPAENIDRAQVAALGSAGPAAGTSVDLDQLAAEIVERAEAYSLDRFALKGRNELIVYVAARLRPLFAERDEIAALKRQLHRTIEAWCDRRDELAEAVRRWHAGAPSWNAEDDLYREMLQLAGVESGTPAGPPVVAAGAGLDVERLAPCPFCGPLADEDSQPQIMTKLEWVTPPAPAIKIEYVPFYSVTCPICYCMASWHLQECEAVHSWNRRNGSGDDDVTTRPTTTRPQAAPSEEARNVE